MTHDELCLYAAYLQKKSRLHNKHFGLIYLKLERIERRMAKFDDDLAAFALAITDDEAAISAIQTLTATQAAKIAELEAEVAAGAPDTTKLEALIAQLKGDNQKLADVATAATTPPTPAPAG